MTHEAEGWVERLRSIPDEHRRFAVDVERAELEFGLDEDMVRGLIAQRLPCGEGEDGPLLAALDLHYIGLRVGCAAVYFNAMHKWVAGLTGAAERGETRMAIRCVAYASEGTPVTALVGPGERATARLGPDRVAAEFEVCTRSVEPAFDPVLDDLWRDAAGLDFCWIPEPLRGDAEFLHRSGLADCASAAPILVDECARRGREARTAFGLLLATPISTPHHWVEVRDDDGRWIPFDPILISLLTRFAGLDGTTWPPSRSPGAILLRLADHATPLVWTEEEPLEASFQARLTTRIPFRRPSGARA